VLIREIAAISAIFAVVPVVIVLVTAVVNTELHTGFLRLGPGHEYDWCGEGRSQDE
jgi:hypothetical protein